MHITHQLREIADIPNYYLVLDFENSHPTIYYTYICTEYSGWIFYCRFVLQIIIFWWLSSYMLHQKFGGMFLKCVLCKFLFLSLALSSRLAYHNLICTISLTRKKWIIFITQAYLWIIPNCLQFFFKIWLLNAHWRNQNELFFSYDSTIYIYIYTQTSI